MSRWRRASGKPERTLRALRTAPERTLELPTIPGSRAGKWQAVTPSCRSDGPHAPHQFREDPIGDRRWSLRGGADCEAWRLGATERSRQPERSWNCVDHGDRESRSDCFARRRRRRGPGRCFAANSSSARRAALREKQIAVPRDRAALRSSPSMTDRRLPLRPSVLSVARSCRETGQRAPASMWSPAESYASGQCSVAILERDARHDPLRPKLAKLVPRDWTRARIRHSSDCPVDNFGPRHRPIAPTILGSTARINAALLSKWRG